MATWVGAGPAVLKPAVATVPVPPGLPVPPTTPLAKPAEATLPMSWPPGTPLATPAPKEVPETAPLRAAPAPVAAPGALLKLPPPPVRLGGVGVSLGPDRITETACFDVRFHLLLAVSVGFGLENSPTLGCGGGATALGGAGGSLG
jgi:hypothetical protein